MMKRLIQALASYCEHPMIKQEADGRWYCTECQAQVA